MDSNECWEGIDLQLHVKECLCAHIYFDKWMCTEAITIRDVNCLVARPS